MNPIDGADDSLGSATRFDPTITFDDDGRVYVGYGVHAADGRVTVVVASDDLDGGQSFDRFTTVESQLGHPVFPVLDKWFLASGRDPTTGNPAVYIAYSAPVGIVVAGSNNGGASFTAPIAVSSPTTGGLFACPAVGPNGELYISWWDIAGGR
ncbi:hypothetical protein [Fontivita pretiosa]|uniref:hypothetical protein n=1 Tax=Fontivita pretiosa TaxID=2989684 RepID=UPI003D17D964